MNSPYMGKFMVTQAYKGSVHDGLDLAGIDSKEIHSTVTGTVTFSGWENPDNPLQGFGKYVQIKQSGSEDYYYFGHLSEIFVKVGQAVNVTDIIGIEGSTGHSTGSHCHYCVRRNGIKGSHRDISAISGIPNAEGVYDDGYRQSRRYSHSWSYEASEAVRQLQNILIAKGLDIAADGIAGEQTLSACKVFTIGSGDSGELTKWVQNRLNSLGFNCGAADGIAGTKTMIAIARFQEENGLGIGYLGGEDWYYLINN